MDFRFFAYLILTLSAFAQVSNCSLQVLEWVSPSGAVFRKDHAGTEFTFGDCQINMKKDNSNNGDIHYTAYNGGEHPISMNIYNNSPNTGESQMDSYNTFESLPAQGRKLFKIKDNFLIFICSNLGVDSRAKDPKEALTIFNITDMYRKDQSSLSDLKGGFDWCAVLRPRIYGLSRKTILKRYLQLGRDSPLGLRPLYDARAPLDISINGLKVDLNFDGAIVKINEDNMLSVELDEANGGLNFSAAVARIQLMSGNVRVMKRWVSTIEKKVTMPIRSKDILLLAWRHDGGLDNGSNLDTDVSHLDHLLSIVVKKENPAKVTTDQNYIALIAEPLPVRSKSIDELVYSSLENSGDIFSPKIVTPIPSTAADNFGTGLTRKNEKGRRYSSIPTSPSMPTIGQGLRGEFSSSTSSGSSGSDDSSREATKSNSPRLMHGSRRNATIGLVAKNPVEKLPKSPLDPQTSGDHELAKHFNEQFSISDSGKVKRRSNSRKRMSPSIADPNIFKRPQTTSPSASISDNFGLLGQSKPIARSQDSLITAGSSRTHRKRGLSSLFPWKRPTAGELSPIPDSPIWTQTPQSGPRNEKSSPDSAGHSSNSIFTQAEAHSPAS